MNEDQFKVAIDCIIFGFDQSDEKLKLLLIKRDFNPGKGKWSLMTGFLKYSETFDEAANRILKDQTGIQDIYLEQLHAYSGKLQEDKLHSVAISYFALINIHEKGLLTQNHSAAWFTLDEKPGLVFDHGKMVSKAILRLRRRTITKPIGFRLLPKKFTIRQLLRLYEEIWEQEFDRRNFIKKINSLDILVKLNEKDKTSSRKGSFLYQFDRDKFLSLEKEGFTFIAKRKNQ